ncbi:BLUF domain-containing protein [Hymenobacter sp.]|uniref:BLUF domain-containing protein n=1 Tax=Hymenobacter sp. TaxID=1898978 RepID=UPI00286B58D2|nr:BLUF domain-containing protein [Hymenobacter sp.]
MPHPAPDTEVQRRRAVAWAVALTADTPLAPQRYERALLARYQEGTLTLDQVIDLLDACVYQVLYRSRATRPFNENQLQQLIEKSRRHNAEHGITGLLLYSESRFVQVLEGPQDAVRAVYARVQQDSRHTQVVTVSEGPTPVRRFAEWSMGLGHAAGPAVVRALETVVTQEIEPGTLPDDSLLQALLQAFGVERAKNTHDPFGGGVGKAGKSQ